MVVERDGRLSRKDLLVAVRVERIDVDQIDAAVWQLAEPIHIIAAVNDARFNERRGFGWRAGSYPAEERSVNNGSR
jgi:hypothetical protein